MRYFPSLQSQWVFQPYLVKATRKSLKLLDFLLLPLLNSLQFTEGLINYYQVVYDWDVSLKNSIADMWVTLLPNLLQTAMEAPSHKWESLLLPLARTGVRWYWITLIGSWPCPHDFRLPHVPLKKLTLFLAKTRTLT